SFWSVEINMSNVWIPLVSHSNNFTLLGTDQTGTSVIRQMDVGFGPYSGTLKVTYSATAGGPLKWSLEFDSSATASYRLVYKWANLTDIVDLCNPLNRIRVSYPSDNYTLSWADVTRSMTSNASLRDSGRVAVLSISIGTVVSGSRAVVD